MGLRSSDSLLKTSPTTILFSYNSPSKIDLPIFSNFKISALLFFSEAIQTGTRRSYHRKCQYRHANASERGKIQRQKEGGSQGHSRLYGMRGRGADGPKGRHRSDVVQRQ